MIFSFYKTHSKTIEPIYYLKDKKIHVWKKFSQIFSNSVKRTTFIKKLENYIYQKDLDKLCPICSDYDYNIFAIVGSHFTFFFHPLCSNSSQGAQLLFPPKKRIVKVFIGSTIG